MAGKIKCTYENCFKHFATVEAMKKHKAKDDTHEYYCKRCDHDSTDDTLLFLHQITSPKHICCPVCCREFKSEGGRDRHVEIDHVPKQSMNCAGCGLEFHSASSLMHHIENNDCEVIKRFHFHRQRTEKQIMKDALSAVVDPTAGTTILSNTAGNPAARAELTLLDDERAWVNTDWQGNPVHDPENERNGPYVGVADGDLDRTINAFPPLHAQPASLSNITNTTPASRSGTWNSSGNVNEETYNNRTNDAWTSPLNTDVWSQNKLNRVSETKSVNLLDQDDLSHLNDSVATWGSRRSHAAAPTPKMDSIHIPHHHPHSNQNAHIKSVSQIELPSTINIDRFWDPIAENYACPGHKCGQRYTSIDSFKTHLISDPVHIGGKVICPGCLKEFKKTSALLAHCESGSRKCKVRNALDYDVVIKEITAGLIAVDGYLEDGGIKYTAQRIEDWDLLAACDTCEVASEHEPDG